MKSSLWSRAWLGVFFLSGLLLALSCRFGTEPAQAPNETLKEIGKDDSHGVKLDYEKAGFAKAPAKVAFLFRATTKSGVPLTNLACGNFILLEDGEPISKYESAYRIVSNPEVFQMHTLLLLDLSGSIVDRDQTLDSLKIAATKLVRALLASGLKNTDLSVHWFDGGTNINQLIDFTADTLALLNAIAGVNKNTRTDKSTNLNGAIVQGIDKIKAKVFQKKEGVSYGTLVLFSDGKDRAGRVATDKVTMSVNNAGSLVAIYALNDPNGESDSTMLKQISREHFSSAHSFQALINNFRMVGDKIVKEVQSRYWLEYCSPKRKGEHKLTVQAQVVDSSQGKLDGTLTLAFFADNFVGGCEILSPCPQ
jgi:hypothetical protein